MIVGKGVGNIAPIIGSGVSIAAPIALSAAGATAAIPYIGPAIAGVSLLIGLFTKKGKQKTATTQIVNQAEPLLKQNLAAWNSSNKTPQEQAQALQNFDAIWGEVVAACSNPSYGDPGHWCIDDRNRGGKWDWFSYYRDPIANDPNVRAISTLDNVSSVFGSGGNNIILFGALGLMIYLIVSK